MYDTSNSIVWSKGPTGLKLMTKNFSKHDEYREWDPYESELAAAMINGLEIFPIQKNSKVLCLDKNFEFTLNHLLDIIGIDGKINLISKKNSTDELQKNYENFSNIDIIDISLKNFPNDFDVFYINIPEENSFEIIKKLKTNLKKDGYFLLILNTDEIRESDSEPTSLFQQIKSSFEIIQVVFLDSYFKNQTMILGRQI